MHFRLRREIDEFDRSRSLSFKSSAVRGGSCDRSLPVISPVRLEAQPRCQPRHLSPRPKRLLGLWSREIKRLVLFRVPLVEPSLQIGGCSRTCFLSGRDFAETAPERAAANDGQLYRLGRSIRLSARTITSFVGEWRELAVPSLSRGGFFHGQSPGVVPRFSTRSRHRVADQQPSISGSFPDRDLHRCAGGHPGFDVGRNKTVKVRPNLPAKDNSIDDAAGCFGRDDVLGVCARRRNADACHQGGGQYRFHGGLTHGLIQLAHW
jgi:hypothetical protein